MRPLRVGQSWLRSDNERVEGPVVAVRSAIDRAVVHSSGLNLPKEAGEGFISGFLPFIKP